MYEVSYRNRIQEILCTLRINLERRHDSLNASSQEDPVRHRSRYRFAGSCPSGQPVDGFVYCDTIGLGELASE
jgi:hypothetical protein